MKPDDIKVAVGHFLELVVNGRGSEVENVAALEVALDMLAWIQNLVEVSDSEGHPDAPQHEFDKMRMLIEKQFPTFGKYNVPVRLTDQNGQAEGAQADAIDDLAEIACRLYEVAWRFQNTSESDALRVFAESYENTWRSRLRALQWYLEAHRENGL